MKLSDTSKDFERIEEPEHIEKIRQSIDKETPKYFDLITNSAIGTHSLGKAIAWTTLINEGIEKFEKECASYVDFFSEDNMDEFEEIDDPKAFKSELRKQCPIIRKTLMSRMEELQDWKEDFAKAKPIELFETFANFLDFQNNYVQKNSSRDFNQLDNFEDFEDFKQFTSDKDLTLQNVIGAGISSTIIYNLNPRYFCKSVRKTLYGLYFLTEDIHHITPSRTSEFIMVDDNPRKSARGSQSNFRMEHNYWYHYNLFMYYTSHIYKILKSLLKGIGITINDAKRFVYVSIFLEQICAIKKDAVQTMMGGDQDY